MVKKLYGYIISIFILFIFFIKPRMIFSISNGLDIYTICIRVVFLISILFLFSRAVEKYFE